MNIQQAVLSGKPFKTPKMTDYLYTKNGFFYWLKDNVLCANFAVEAVLSSEWQILEPINNIIKFNKPFITKESPPEAS